MGWSSFQESKAAKESQGKIVTRGCAPYSAEDDMDLMRFNQVCDSVLGYEYADMARQTTWKGQVAYELQVSQGGGTLWVTWDSESSWRYGDMTGTSGQGQTLSHAKADCEAQYEANFQKFQSD